MLALQKSYWHLDRFYNACRNTGSCRNVMGIKKYSIATVTWKKKKKRCHRNLWGGKAELFSCVESEHSSQTGIAGRFPHTTTSLLTPAVLREMQSVPFSQPRRWNVQYLLPGRKGGTELFMLCALIHGTTKVGRHREDAGAQGILEPLRAAGQHPCWQQVIPVHCTGFFLHGLKATWLQMRLSCSARWSSPEHLLQAWFYQNTCIPVPASSRLPMEPCLAAARHAEDLLAFCAFREASRLLQFPGSLVSLTSQGH